MDLYPAAPREVPPDLTAPSRAYRLHAWLALLGILGFVSLYLGLAGYCGWTAFRLFRATFMGGGGSFVAFFLALPPTFFFLFLVRGLFSVRHREDATLVEVLPEDEPELFDFIHHVSRDAGAPRPHRVFLSSRVNAAVFYDLRFWNLIFPSKKNLELGLGLINALSLDELKAVVAHEFGHFAQRSMAVGRWVYVATQIAGHIIGSRGAFDKLLDGLSRTDLRIAWIGWIGKLLVWAIRAILDTAFRIIVLAHRALTREMELQADLVSVSVSGSDSLIHALHRLSPADEAWNEAADFVDAELGAGRSVPDLFSIQARALERLREVLGDPTFGQTPERPERRPSEFRVFDDQLAQAPRMWATHPPNREREDNAKARYVASTLDARSAWSLFRDPERTRRAVTASLIPPPPEGAEARVELDEKDALAKLDERFDDLPLERRYRGVYLGRSITRPFAEPEEAFAPEADERDPTRDELLEKLDALYPESLIETLESLRSLHMEHAQLEGLEAGVLSAPGGVIRHRGEEIPRKRLRAVIEQVQRERDDAEAIVEDHDCAVRTAYRSVARSLDENWASYHQSLVELLHYAEHVRAFLRETADNLGNELAVAVADGKISEREWADLARAATKLYPALASAYDQRYEVVVPDAVGSHLSDADYADIYGEDLRLDPPILANIDSWLQVIDSWMVGPRAALSSLAGATLTALLECEATLERSLREGTELPSAPEPAENPDDYPRLIRGEEGLNRRQLSLWDRFQRADGFVAGSLRFVVATALLAPALLFTSAAGDSTVTVYNGLSVPIEVSLGGASARIDGRGHASVEIVPSDELTVRATTTDGREVERFTVDTADGFAKYVYNVAGAAPLYEWSALYGRSRGQAERSRGASRWHETSATILFEEPPRQVETRSGGAERRVLTAVTDIPPAEQVELVRDPSERARMIEAHLRFDSPDDRDRLAWEALAAAENVEP